MKKILLSFILFIGITTSFAVEKETEFSENMSGYKPSYLIAGNLDDQILIQASFKYKMFGSYRYGGFYGGYTQIMDWEFYDASNPFRNIDFNPEFFYLKEFSDLPIDYIIISPAEHKSNGQDGENNRSINYSYLKTQTTFGNKTKFGWETKTKKSWFISNDNKDIDKYLGYWDAKIFVKLEQGNMKEEFYVKLAAGSENYGFDFTKGYQEYGVIFSAFKDIFSPSFYVQVRRGYGETLLDYDKKDTAIRAGIILK